MDREKVIKGLEHCFHGQECCGDIECPYYIEHLSDCCCLEECQENLKTDALALLKEQQEYIEYWSAKYDEYGKAYIKVRDERDALLNEQENANKRNPVIVCPHCGKRVK